MASARRKAPAKGETGKARLGLSIESALKRKLVIAAATHGLTAGEIVEAALRSYLPSLGKQPKLEE